MKKTFIFSSLLMVTIVFFWLYQLFAPVISTQGGLVYYLRSGASEQSVIADLAKQNIIRHPKLFSFYLIFQKKYQLKSGEYLFPNQANLLSIWRQITTGTGFFYHSFTIIPGWNMNQLRHALLQTNNLKHISAGLTDEQLMVQCGNAMIKPEGEFFPETYYYTRDISDVIILKRAFILMQKRLNETWEKRALNLPYRNAYEALIAASLIEKEARLKEERPIIAGVLINRLRRNMLLQFDPTVIYGMGQRFQGKIHQLDLMEKTLYNTYVFKGLPPTPIAMPSMDSIVAALHPEQHDYYYFVAKGDGSHQFSKTLKEHHAAVKKNIFKANNDAK